MARQLRAIRGKREINLDDWEAYSKYIEEESEIESYYSSDSSYSSESETEYENQSKSKYESTIDDEYPMHYGYMMRRPNMIDPKEIARLSRDTIQNLIREWASAPASDYATKMLEAHIKGLKIHDNPPPAKRKVIYLTYAKIMQEARTKTLTIPQGIQNLKKELKRLDKIEQRIASLEKERLELY